MTHLVAFGPITAANADASKALGNAAEEAAAAAGWPATVVMSTRAGETLCGLRRPAASRLKAWASATLGDPDLCPGCVEAAAKAGRPLQ